MWVITLAFGLSSLNTKLLWISLNFNTFMTFDPTIRHGNKETVIKLILGHSNRRDLNPFIVFMGMQTSYTT